MSARNALARWRRRRTQIRPFTDLQSEINNVFDGLWQEFEFEPVQNQIFAPSVFRPVVDASETDTSYAIRAELPGLDENDFELTLSDGALTLKGRKKFEQEETKSNIRLSERSYGSFHRSFSLSTDSDAEKITAAFDKGLLTVTVPKTKAAQKPAKEITIEKG